MSQIERTTIQPENVWVPKIYPYSHAVSFKTEKLLTISGQVALNIDADYVGIDDIVAQTRQVYANLGNTLESAGTDFAHLIELTTFIVGRENLPAHLKALKEIYKEIYPKGDYPADTVLLVNGLYREEFLIEVKAVAVIS